MKKTLFFLSCLFSAGIQAGTQTYTSNDVMIPIPSSNIWTGFYAGINSGYATGTNTTNFSLLTTVTALEIFSASASVNMTGGVFGAQVGYDWQLGRNHYEVIGIETDFDGTTLSGSAFQTAIGTDALAGIIFPDAFYTTQKIYFLGSIRPIIGILTPSDNWLIYFTGGFAYADIKETGNANFVPVTTGQIPATISAVQPGWAGGAGVEWKFDHHFSAGLEYLYYDFNSLAQNGNQTKLTLEPGAGFLIHHDSHFNIGYQWQNTVNVIRININYHFQ